MSQKCLSGSLIVDEISQLHINSIPQAWFKTIRRSNQPHGMAIHVLWDLLYWYKWTEIRDEATGLVTGYKKKFKADLLQRSYSAIAAKFGITKRMATDIIVYLEKLGVVKRHFRTIVVQGNVLNNVLYIELIPETIKKLSDERNCIEEVEDESVKDDISMDDSTPPLSRKNETGHPQKCETNTNDYTNNYTNFDYDCAEKSARDFQTVPYKIPEPIELHAFYLKHKLRTPPLEFWNCNEKHGWIDNEGKQIENWCGAYKVFDERNPDLRLKHDPGLVFNPADYKCMKNHTLLH